MADAHIEHHWLAFDSLDHPGLSPVKSFAFAYRFTDERGELWTERFNSVKFSSDPSPRNAAKAMMAEALDFLISGLGITRNETAFVTALGSEQLAASTSGIMESIASECAQRSGCTLNLQMLSKNAHQSLSSGRLDADERAEQLEAANYVAGSTSASNVFVFDDFITSGTTLSYIAQAIRLANPETHVYAVALGKTERRSWVGPDVMNNHIPQAWADVWTQNYRR